MLLLLLLANRLQLSTKLVVLFNDERGELVHVLGRLQQPRIPATHARGVVLKRSGGQDLDKDFLNNLGLHTRTLIHVRKIATADLWSCPAIQLLVFECL